VQLVDFIIRNSFQCVRRTLKHSGTAYDFIPTDRQTDRRYFLHFQRRSNNRHAITDLPWECMFAAVVPAHIRPYEYHCSQLNL